MTMRVRDIRRHFKDELRQERFIIDKTGAKTITKVIKPKNIGHILDNNPISSPSILI